MRLDPTGKISFDHIYTQPDPRAYFHALRRLDYTIPELAKPYFAKLIQEYREATGVAVPTVLDIGCSYGINAAMLRCDATMDGMAERYAQAGHLDRDALVARDREYVRGRGDDLRFVGFDASLPALTYAHAAGLIDDAVHADLEHAEPTLEQRAKLADIDVVISTGCVGYVTENTLTRVAASARRRPWMAHFVLRMFSFAPMAEALGRMGYQTESVDGVFRQRRFASAEEQTQVLDNLAASGVDPTGLEADGWLHARLFVSRPAQIRDESEDAS